VKKILVVDDEKLIRWSLQRDLEKSGFAVTSAETAEAGLRALEDEPPDLILLDFKLPGKSGLESLPEFRRRLPQVPVILMSAHGGVETAVAAMKAGAFHYVHKPFNKDELHLTISNALETGELRSELARMRSSSLPTLEDFLGESPRIVETRSVALRAAQSPTNMILLYGESGTGKDLLARIIHALSTRSAHPFMTINCSALPENLLESELFGYEKGAFTDARDAKRGLFDAAGEGSVYLDEIGDMMPGLQAKLLSVLENRRFRPLGATREVGFKARVIAATNRDLGAAVKAGRFREDLYYRLNVMPIKLPPLRERGRDILLLALHFLTSIATEYRRPMRKFSADAETALLRHSWPGNVRELRNVIERLVIIENVTVVEAQHLALDSREHRPAAEGDSTFTLPPEGIDLEALERSMIKQALQMADGNQTRAAKLLGISRDTLRYRLSKMQDG